jgi:hypothetical protein
MTMPRVRRRWVALRGSALALIVKRGLIAVVPICYPDALGTHYFGKLAKRVCIGVSVDQVFVADHSFRFLQRGLEIRRSFAATAV